MLEFAFTRRRRLRSSRDTRPQISSFQRYIVSQRGRGTYVADTLPRRARRAQTEHLTESAQRLLTQAYLAGHSFTDVVQLLKAADRTLADVTSTSGAQRSVFRHRTRRDPPAATVSAVQPFMR